MIYLKRYGFEAGLTVVALAIAFLVMPAHARDLTPRVMAGLNGKSTDNKKIDTDCTTYNGFGPDCVQQPDGHDCSVCGINALGSYLGAGPVPAPGYKYTPGSIDCGKVWAG